MSRLFPEFPFIERLIPGSFQYRPPGSVSTIDSIVGTPGVIVLASNCVLNAAATSWDRIDTARPAMHVSLNASTGIYGVYYAAAGANPIAWTEIFRVDSRCIVRSAAWDPPSLAPGASTTLTLATVTGAAVTDFALASFDMPLAVGLVYVAEVTAANQVRVTLTNVSGAAIDQVGMTVFVRVFPK